MKNNFEPRSVIAKEIYFYFTEGHKKKEAGVYNAEKIKEWMKCRNVEALGVLYYFLTEKRYYMKIDPPLNFQDYFYFIKDYFSLCFKEDPDDIWADSKYGAGWDLVGWFKHFWEDKNIPRKYLKDIKTWIGELYKGGNKELKECIGNATLDHLFENKEIRRFFSDWEKDPDLVEAYKRALEWSDKMPEVLSLLEKDESI